MTETMLVKLFEHDNWANMKIIRVHRDLIMTARLRFDTRCKQQRSAAGCGWTVAARTVHPSHHRR
jgi:hypothetical protein